MKNNHVFVMRKRQRPLDHEWENNEQESRMLDAWQIGSVEDLVDDSVQYIQEELTDLGIPQQMISEVTERIKNNVLSVWARRVLFICCDGLEPEGTDDFLARKFTAPD